MAGQIIARKEGAVGWLIFSNPERYNAMSEHMWAAVPDVVANFAADEAIRLMVLRGDGGAAFVSGADISQFDAIRANRAQAAAYSDGVSKATAAIADFPRPTLAVIDGFCLGGGLAIAASCDLRIAVATARFGIPAGRLGVGYEYDSMERVVRVIGPAFTKEIMYTARQFSADEALAMGLVNRIAAPDEFEAMVRDMVSRIAENAPMSIRAAKMAIDAAVDGATPAELAAVHDAVAACIESADYKEGRTAFLAKRRPQFKGR